MSNKYFVKVKDIIKNTTGFSYTNIGIYNYKKQEIGSYIRNHPPQKKIPFFPFQQDNQWYALYSPKYYLTRIMSLPDGTDIGGETEEEVRAELGYCNGFCTYEFFVPFGNKFKDKKFDSINGKIGFASGCYWGDDWSTKIQYLDLSEVKNGIIKREEKFGYLCLPDHIPLDKCISFNNYTEENKIIDIAFYNVYYVSSRRLTYTSNPKETGRINDNGKN